jgi:hypothetical protein
MSKRDDPKPSPALVPLLSLPENWTLKTFTDLNPTADRKRNHRRHLFDWVNYRILMKDGVTVAGDDEDAVVDFLFSRILHRSIGSDAVNRLLSNTKQTFYLYGKKTMKNRLVINFRTETLTLTPSIEAMSQWDNEFKKKNIAIRYGVRCKNKRELLAVWIERQIAYLLAVLMNPIATVSERRTNANQIGSSLFFHTYKK